MGTPTMLVLTVLTLLQLFSLTQQQEKFKLEFQWSHIEYIWPSEEIKAEALASGDYIPENNLISSVQVYKDDLIFATPRFRPGVPFSLARIPLRDGRDRKTNVPLRPYPPNPEINPINNCDCFQNVYNVELDPLRGYLWVLDGIRTPYHVQTECPPKIFVLDLNNHGTIVHTYEFPPQVAGQGAFFLSASLDGDDNFAYIADASMNDPGIIVCCKASGRSWKLRDRTTQPDMKTSRFIVNGVHVNGPGLGVSAVALSPTNENGNRVLYFTDLFDFVVYSVETHFIMDEDDVKTGEWKKEVKSVVRKPGLGLSITVDNYCNLYAGLINLNAVAIWNTKEPNSTITLLDYSSNFNFVDTFSFDHRGYMRFLANDAARYFYPDQPLVLDGKIKFRLYKLRTGTQSYFYGESSAEARRLIG